MGPLHGFHLTDLPVFRKIRLALEKYHQMLKLVWDGPNPKKMGFTVFYDPMEMGMLIFTAGQINGHVSVAAGCLAHLGVVLASIVGCGVLCRSQGKFPEARFVGHLQGDGYHQCIQIPDSFFSLVSIRRLDVKSV